MREVPPGCALQRSSNGRWSGLAPASAKWPCGVCTPSRGGLQGSHRPPTPGLNDAGPSRTGHLADGRSAIRPLPFRGEAEAGTQVFAAWRTLEPLPKKWPSRGRAGPSSRLRPNSVRSLGDDHPRRPLAAGRWARTERAFVRLNGCKEPFTVKGSGGDGRTRCRRRGPRGRAGAPSSRAVKCRSGQGRQRPPGQTLSSSAASSVANSA